MRNCGLCGGTHTTFVRQMADGSSHVYVDQATLARRNELTDAAISRFDRLERAGNRLDDGSNEAIADREDFDFSELNP